MSKNKQNKIIHWFDTTYKNQRFSYLRPSKAYEVFIRILDLKFWNAVLGPDSTNCTDAIVTVTITQHYDRKNSI